MACVYFMRKKVSCPQIRHSCQPLIITFTVQSDKKNREVGEKNTELRCDPPKWEKRNRISGCQLFTISF